MYPFCCLHFTFISFSSFSIPFDSVHFIIKLFKINRQHLKYRTAFEMIMACYNSFLYPLETAVFEKCFVIFHSNWITPLLKLQFLCHKQTALLLWCRYNRHFQILPPHKMLLSPYPLHLKPALLPLRLSCLP